MHTACAPRARSMRDRAFLSSTASAHAPHQAPHIHHARIVFPMTSSTTLHVPDIAFFGRSLAQYRLFFDIRAVTA